MGRPTPGCAVTLREVDGEGVGELLIGGRPGLELFREYLDDPAHPLPCYRVGGKILVRRSEFDRWIATYRTRGHVGGDHLVSDVLSRLR